MPITCCAMQPLVVYAVGSGGLVLKTDNGGDTWNPNEPLKIPHWASGVMHAPTLRCERQGMRLHDAACVTLLMPPAFSLAYRDAPCEMPLMPLTSGMRPWDTRIEQGHPLHRLPQRGLGGRMQRVVRDGGRRRELDLHQPYWRRCKQLQRHWHQLPRHGSLCQHDCSGSQGAYLHHHQTSRR